MCIPPFLHYTPKSLALVCQELCIRMFIIVAFITGKKTTTHNHNHPRKNLLLMNIKMDKLW